MIRLFILIILLYSGTASYGKPYQGKYILTGKIYDKLTLKPLINKSFYINGVEVVTDFNGNYNFEIEWKTADSFYFKSYRKKQEANKKLNKEYIEIVYNQYKITIKNKWKKYGLRRVNKLKKKNYVKDLYL